MDLLPAVFEEAQTALARQGDNVLRKTESLRQLARMGVAAMAGVLAGAGLLSQNAAAFPASANLVLAAGSVAIVFAVVAAIVAATILDASDLSVGPDPEALYRTANQMADRRSFDTSRIEGLLRVYRYNQASLDRIAKRARLALLTLVGGALLTMSGFALVLGASIA